MPALPLSLNRQVGELFLANSSSAGKLGGEAGGCLLQALAWEDEVARNDLQVNTGASICTLGRGRGKGMGR